MYEFFTNAYLKGFISGANLEENIMFYSDTLRTKSKYFTELLPSNTFRTNIEWTILSTVPRYYTGPGCSKAG